MYTLKVPAKQSIKSLCLPFETTRWEENRNSSL